MRRVCMLVIAVFAGMAAWAQPDPALEKLRADAAAVAPLVKAPCVREFLEATAALPAVEPRTVYSQREPRAAFSEDKAARLPEEQRAKLTKREFTTARYYDTFYGSPLAYARPLDLCAAAGLASYQGKRILDYGYGTVGHLRLLASCGARATGVDVDPVLRVLYSAKGDQGEIAAAKNGAAPGRLTLIDGFWPGDEPTRSAAGAGYDLFISKNTLKNGYVHPPEGTDPRRAITLGVSDEQFLRALAEAVKPGGLLMIYNLGPAPAPPDQPASPMADIRCPFARALWEAAGFEVIEFDRDDSVAARTQARALGWDQGASPMDIEHDLFGSYSLFKRR
jgi:SAM-dependent methyltransferase